MFRPTQSGWPGATPWGACTISSARTSEVVTTAEVLLLPLVLNNAEVDGVDCAKTGAATKPVLTAKAAANNKGLTKEFSGVKKRMTCWERGRRVKVPLQSEWREALQK